MIVDKIKKREPTAKRNINKVDIQVGKWVKCEKCKEILYKEDQHRSCCSMDDLRSVKQQLL